jgi:hypothetical protein
LGTCCKFAGPLPDISGGGPLGKNRKSRNLI